VNATSFSIASTSTSLNAAMNRLRAADEVIDEASRVPVVARGAIAHLIGKDRRACSAG
jgi:hypothetical protein